MTIEWSNAQRVYKRTWVCGHCGDKVASGEGYNAQDSLNRQEVCIRICPGCDRPTFFYGSYHAPQNAPGNRINDVPTELHSLYDEARESYTASAYTGAVMICRKILMNIAVDKGAAAGESFLQYIEYLDQAGYLPPDGMGWVDYVRKRGNEANHEIQLMENEDAKTLIAFVEMLLRFIYQFPNMVPQASGVKSP